MRRMILTFVAAASLSFAGTAAAQTGGAHVTKGGTPVCTDVGTQLECTAEVAGLGNETVVASVQRSGTATALTCTTPPVNNQASVQNPAVPVTAGGTQTIQNTTSGLAIV